MQVERMYMPVHKVRVGIVGLGAVHWMHDAGYSEVSNLAEVKAVCDIDEDLAKSRAEYYGAKVYTDYRALVSNPEIDMVDVTVPHHLHYPVTMAALENGKHVLVEKPIATSSIHGEEMIQKAQQVGVKFSVAENTHFVPVYNEVRRLLSEGLLGDIWTVRTCVDASDVARIKDPLSWAGRGLNQGVILDCSVHSFYLLKWLFGGVREIRGTSYKIIQEGEFEDNGIMTGRLQNGAHLLAVVSSTTQIPPYREVLEVFGSKGGILVDLLRMPPAVYYEGDTAMECTRLEAPHDPIAWKILSMIEEVKSFVLDIIEERTPLLDPSDALHAVKVVEAVNRSIELGISVKVV